ncbi:hypothetical protein EU527_17895 [Candidatus Thorarchaeota archaeon]|nr:MAG: hypothetical protein EU527_17895 [Candidatus Thorarchaeota archaeon]
MQFEWIFALFTAQILLLLVLFIVIYFIIQGFFLGIGLGFVNGKNRNIGSTMVTALLMTLVIWIPCLGCILAWYFIKSRHDVGWIDALIAWILGAIVALVVVIAIAFAFGMGGALMGILTGLIPMGP